MLLDVASLADYDTLDALRFANRQLHRLVTDNRDKLAKRTGLALIFDAKRLYVKKEDGYKSTLLEEEEEEAGVRPESTLLTSALILSRSRRGFMNALTTVAPAIGQRAVTCLSVVDGDCQHFPMATIFSVLPSMRFVTEVRIQKQSRPINAEAMGGFLGHFTYLEAITLTTDRMHFDWSSFLRKECALRVQTSYFCASGSFAKDDIMRHCAELSC